VTPPPAGRVASIDLLRGADVLLMLFVNEVAGVPGAPSWLLHVSAETDGMTVTDVVFPAFLFIVGIAVPLALGGRLRRGVSKGEALRHVLARSAALVVMGVLMVNAEHGVSGPLSAPVWNLVATAGILLAWGAPDGGWGPLRRPWLRATGFALLALAALAYRSPSPEVTGLVHLRPHWWGILGLIGWAYLAVSVIYLLVGERKAALVGLVALLYCLALADAAGGLGPFALRPFVGAVLGTHAAIVLAGTLLGVLLREHLRTGGPWRALVGRAAALGAGLAAAGFLLHAFAGLHPAFRVSKIHATAPWGLYCSALTLAAWIAFFLLADVVGFRRFPRSLGIAGENPLVAYLLAPALLSVLALAAPLVGGGTNPYEALASPTALGLLRSAVFAWLVVRLTGLLRSRGVRVQL
jgi:predicted acyltransferase